MKEKNRWLLFSSPQRKKRRFSENDDGYGFENFYLHEVGEYELRSTQKIKHDLLRECERPLLVFLLRFPFTQKKFFSFFSSWRMSCQKVSQKIEHYYDRGRRLHDRIFFHETRREE